MIFRRGMKTSFPKYSWFWVTVSMPGKQKFKNTETISWIEKHTLTSTEISSIFLKDPFLFNLVNPSDLVSSFTDALENCATQKKRKWKRNSCKLQQQNEPNSHIFSKHLSNVGPVESTSKRTASKNLLTMSQQSLYQCKNTADWYAGSLVEKFLTKNWIQQCKLRYKVDQGLFTTQTLWRKRRWGSC